jgi:hypothetical protein
MIWQSEKFFFRLYFVMSVLLFRYLATIPMRDSCDLPMTITADAK